MLRFGPFRLDPADQRLWRGSTPVELRPKTFAVLRYLAERPGKLVRNEELLDAVWEGAAITPGTLNTSIRELRKALGDDARNPRFIETVHRLGFRFVAPLGSDAGDAVADEGADDPARILERLTRAASDAGRRRMPRESAGYARRAIELLAAIGHLSDEEKEAVRLRYLHRLSSSEIARRTATSDEAVASRVLGALGRLGRHLERRGESRR